MNFSYERLKTWCKYHKTELAYLTCSIAMFFVGFGTGQEWGREDRLPAPTQPINYTTKPLEPTVKEETNQPVTSNNQQVLGDNVNKQITNINSSKTGECVVKGNISGGNKIYHVSGGAFYERTNPEQCFNSEVEAKAAGFRKSSR